MIVRITFGLLLILMVLVITPQADAGKMYFITSSDGKISYKVRFGGGKASYVVTAFDLTSKQFVYISLDHGKPRPKPVATIWDHTSGETISLYKSPGVEQPLPEIRSFEDMKFFPLTKDKDFKVKPGNWD
jgi:hypothetical protein